MKIQKLQKLCYYTQGWAYVIFGEPIINDSVFKAADSGPVSAELYARFGWDETTEITPESNKPPFFGIAELSLLESVWLTYGGMSDNALVAQSQKEWPYIKAKETQDRQIDPDDMSQYFHSIYKK
ncbi:MAG: DUF4065 domain-containing protein [Clostridia bacterium]|nr:DUF4065 domain-containing protein [Clostridia bacterium]